LSEETEDITEEQVYELLTQDLLNAKNAVIDYIGEDNFNKAPQSIKDALVDIAFNKGIELGFEGIEIKDGAEVKRKTLTKNLKHDIEKQDYASAAKHVIYNTDSNGLKRRNVYRVIMATKDLSEEDRKQVLDATENYYKETKSAQKPLEKSEMTKAWKQAKRGICNNFFD
jgi:GH24 family phage-related lysozyme (muramidase)